MLSCACPVNQAQAAAFGQGLRRVVGMFWHHGLRERTWMRPDSRESGTSWTSSGGRTRSSRDHDRQAPVDRGRHEKLQQSRQVLAGTVTTGKRFREGQWKVDNLNNWHETATCDFPEWRPWKVFAPEHLSASQGSSIGANKLCEFADVACCGPLLHCGDQDDHRTEINLAPKETHRWRRLSRPAAVAIAAEAQSVALLLREIVRAASRPSGVIGTVQATSTRAAPLACVFGKILIDRKKKRPEAGATR